MTMEHGKKMALVPQNMLLPPPPVEPYLNELDSQITRILQDKTMPSDVKAKRYSHALRQYMAFKGGDVPEPVKIPIEESPQTDRLTELLQSIPRNSSNRARMLINHVRKNPDISWNAKNELVYRERTIPNSNALDLVHRFVSPGTKSVRMPTGWREFGNALLLHNAPRSAVVNKSIWDKVEKVVQPQFDDEEDEDVFSPSFATPNTGQRQALNNTGARASSSSNTYHDPPSNRAKRPTRNRRQPKRFGQTGTGWKKW